MCSPDDECEEVVDEGVERLVHEELPRQRGDALQPVVDEELRRHHDEPATVHERDEALEYPRVPALEVAVDEAPAGVADDEQQQLAPSPKASVPSQR